MNKSAQPAGIFDFARLHLLITTIDAEDDTPIIEGLTGHIYEYGDGRLGVIYLGGDDRAWSDFRKRIREAGLEILQNGDGEGAAAFDCCDAAQVRLAFRIAGIDCTRVQPHGTAGRGEPVLLMRTILTA